MIFNDLMDNGKTQTGAFFAGRIKGFKDLFYSSDRDTGAIILYPEMKPRVRCIQLSTDLYVTLGRQRLQCIEQKV